MTTETLKNLVQHADSWPKEDQEALADYGRVIEARRTGLYAVSGEERVAIAEGVEQANRGEFASEEELIAARRRWGI